MIKQSEYKYFKIVLLIWLSAPVIMALILFAIDRFPFLQDRARSGIPLMGQIGDMFGFINSLFTGVTLIGAFIAISRQNEVIADTKAAIKSQEIVNNNQRFDETFFKYIEIYKDAIRNFNETNGSQDLHWYVSEGLRNHVNVGVGESSNGYYKYISSNNNCTGDLVSIFDQILSLIMNSSITDKSKYVKLLWIVMSRDERTLISFHQAYSASVKNLNTDNFILSGMSDFVDNNMMFHFLNFDNYKKLMIEYKEKYSL